MGALALLGVVWSLAGRPSPPPSEAADTISPQLAPSGAARGAPSAPSTTAPASPAAAPPAADPADDAAWRLIRPTSAYRALGPLGRDLQTGARRSRLEVARCYRDFPGGPESARRPAVLELLLEGRAGELEVVDALMAEAGSSPLEQVECARWILRGYRIPSSTVVRGQRFKIRVALEP